MLKVKEDFCFGFPAWASEHPQLHSETTGPFRDSSERPNVEHLLKTELKYKKLDTEIKAAFENGLVEVRIASV